VALKVDLADPIDEHATNLSAFVRKVLSLMFALKTQHSPDLSNLSIALNVARTEARAIAENTAQTLDQIKQELKSAVELVQQSAANIQRNGNTAEEARAAAKDATEVGKATLEVAREIRQETTRAGERTDELRCSDSQRRSTSRYIQCTQCQNTICADTA
tara:strand:- start:2825 stop:3304 length:480 start_codon:yes stop_codon:yes gene_type:complete